MTTNQTTVGVVSVGLKTYWGQFDGLYERLTGYHAEIVSGLHAAGAHIIDAGMVDDEEKAKAAAESFLCNQVDLVFLYISTYSLSSIVFLTVRNIHTKVILLNLQPTPALNYSYINSLADRGRKTGEWLAYCQACSVPEVACVLNRAEIPYEIISGYLGEERAWASIREWVEAARVFKTIRNSRIGIMGHYYEGMLDVYSDLTALSTCFGVHFNLIEVGELRKIRDTVTLDDIKEKMDEFRTSFDVSSECSAFELERAARTAVALDSLVSDKQIDALTYYYEGTSKSEEENIVTSVIAGNTLLTGKGIPVAGECEVKNVIAMKIMSEFGSGGSFSEFYTMDLNDDVVMLGHDGPAHFNMAEDRVKLVPLPVYHGKPGEGLSIHMRVSHGAVTLLSVAETKKGIALIVAEGESVAGEILDIGNTNSRYKFPISAVDFIERWSKAGPSHHCAIGKGHIAGKLTCLSELLHIPIIKIC